MKTSILLVDDDDNIRSNYKDILEDDGYRVVDHGTTEQWTSWFRDAQFSLIILDISINGDRFAGHRLCASLKVKYPNIPVVMLTSLDSYENRTMAFENGADQYWIKSSCPEKFLDDVRSELNKWG